MVYQKLGIKEVALILPAAAFSIGVFFLTGLWIAVDIPVLLLLTYFDVIKTSLVFSSISIPISMFFAWNIYSTYRNIKKWNGFNLVPFQKYSLYVLISIIPLIITYIYIGYMNPIFLGITAAILIIISIYAHNHIVADRFRNIALYIYFITIQHLLALACGYIFLAPFNFIEVFKNPSSHIIPYEEANPLKQINVGNRKINTKNWLPFENYILYFNREQNRYCIRKYDNTFELCGSRFSRIARWLH